MERQNMSSTAITTMVKMMELLPEDMQNKIVEHLRESIEDLNDEMQWDARFQKTQQQLVAAARKVKQEIAEGNATPL